MAKGFDSWRDCPKCAVRGVDTDGYCPNCDSQTLVERRVELGGADRQAALVRAKLTMQKGPPELERADENTIEALRRTAKAQAAQIEALRHRLDGQAEHLRRIDERLAAIEGKAIPFDRIG